MVNVLLCTLYRNKKFHRSHRNIGHFNFINKWSFYSLNLNWLAPKVGRIEDMNTYVLKILWESYHYVQDLRP